MADLMCPSLDRLGTLLQTAYLLRDICTADNKDIRAINEAELNLRRVHNLIVAVPAPGTLFGTKAGNAGRVDTQPLHPGLCYYRVHFHRG